MTILNGEVNFLTEDRTIQGNCNRQVLFHKWKIVYRLQFGHDGNQLYKC